MNQKKIKMLRKQAAAQAVALGYPTETLYTFKRFDKLYQAIDGKIIPYMVYTAKMSACERNLFKHLKKEFKESK